MLGRYSFLLPNRKDALSLAIVYVVLLAVFGTPVALGLSWLSLPYGPYSPLLERFLTGWPAYPVGVDNFSFPHFEWPSREFARQAEHLGSGPYWNPHVGLGIPMLGQYETQMLFPLEILERKLGLQAWNWILVLKIAFAATGAYVFVAQFTQKHMARIAGALCYGMSAYFVWFISIPAFVNGAMMVPWMFVATNCLTSQSIPWIAKPALFALIVGLSMLTGQPQITALALLGCAGFLASLILVERSWRSTAGLSAVAGFAAGTLGALLIALPQLVQFAIAYKWGYSIHTPGAYGNSGTSPLNFTVPFWPYFFGQPMSPWDGRLYPAELNWEAFPILIGGSGLVLALYGVSCMRGQASPNSAVRRGPAIAMCVVTGAILALVLSGTMGIHFWNVRYLDQINLPRYGTTILALGAASILAYGFACMAQARAQRLTGVLLAFVAIMVAVGSLLLRVLPVQIATENSGYAVASIALGLCPFAVCAIGSVILLRALREGKRNVTAVQVGLLFLLVGELSYFVRYGFDIEHELLRLFVVAWFAIAAVVALRSLRAAVLVALPALVAPFVLLVTAGATLPRSVDPYMEPAKHISVLKDLLGNGSRRGRILTTKDVSWPNVASAYGVAQLESAAPMQVMSTARLIMDGMTTDKPFYTMPTQWLGMGDKASNTTISWADFVQYRDVFNALAVRYLVDVPEGILARDPIPDTRVVHRGRVVIYEDQRALPRAFVLPFNDDPVRMNGPRFDLGRTGDLLEALPKMKDLLNLIATSRTEIKSADIGRFLPDTIDMRVDTATRALLVVSDAYFPGWSALVDGAPREIIRVGGSLRGVLVHPGEKLVQMQYAPPLWVGSTTIALVAMLLSLGACGLCFTGIVRGSKPVTQNVYGAPGEPSARMS